MPEVVSRRCLHREATDLFVFTKYDEQGASSRYRFFMYFPAALAAGLRVHVFPLFDAAYLAAKYQHGRAKPLQLLGALLRRLRALLAVPRHATVVIEYELLPFLPAWAEQWLVWRGCRLIVDYDDAIFHQYDQHRSALVRRLLGRKIPTVMRLADTVITGNRYLADYAGRVANQPVAIIPTVVDLRRYPSPVAPRADDCFTIVWIGSPSTAHYLQVVADALARFCRTGDVRVLLIGSGPVCLPGVPVDILSWQEASEFEDICRGDVGIMPLNDDPWSRGKCGFKLIQYMACGLPVIASPVGVNTSLVTPGENGFLAAGTDDWIAALTALRADRDAARGMGLAGRARVASNYCLTATTPRLLALWAAGSDLEVD